VDQVLVCAPDDLWTQDRATEITPEQAP
jgi:hypothetical protein